jgi:FKBP-type peptidyl-prolyl cis-trans isomerase
VIFVRTFRLASAVIALVLASVGISGCDDSPTAPAHFAPFSQTDIRVGTGTDAVTGKLLTVNYTGWLYSTPATDHKGSVFDSSAGLTTPFQFTLGSGQVIRGWDQGIVGMKVGGLRRLIIPPSLAYGGFRNGPIPENATLLFEIELVEVQ